MLEVYLCATFPSFHREGEPIVNDNRLPPEPSLNGTSHLPAKEHRCHFCGGKRRGEGRLSEHGDFYYCYDCLRDALPGMLADVLVMSTSVPGHPDLMGHLRLELAEHNTRFWEAVASYLADRACS
jgi:hypothetical protein